MINVVFLNMEYGIHDHVVRNSDGSVTIFLNARDSHEARMYGYKHAMDHIKKGDFEKHDVQEIEYHAHQ